jgi:hypothetical protein
MMNRFKLTIHVFIIGVLLCEDCSVSAKTINSGYFSITIPDGWKVFDGQKFSSFDGPPAQCIFFRNPINKYQDFALSVCAVGVKPGELLRRIGFQKINGEIVRTGSMDYQKARIQERNGHLMVSAAASCGVSDAAGFHAAGGKCYSAAIFGKQRNVAVETDGTEPLELVSKIVNSIRLRTAGDVQSFKDQLDSVQLDGENHQ